MASSPQRSREIAEPGVVEQAYGSIEEVAESKADVVHICTPNASHVPYAVALMEGGKHVLCEKPLGVSLGDARQAAQVAEDTGWSTPSRSRTGFIRWCAKCRPGCWPRNLAPSI